MNDTITMRVPRACATDVEDVINKHRSKQNPKPIKRKLRITKQDFKNAREVIRVHVQYGKARDRWLNKLGNEYERLEDLVMSARTDADAKWLNNQLDLLENAIQYAEDA